MFPILLRRELLANLMGFRFFVATILCLLLVVTNAVVLVDDYERRLGSYHTAVKTHHQKVLETKTYSALRLSVDRPPNLLSLFNQGLDRRLGDTVEIYHGFVPTLWDADLHGSDNPFLNLFSSIDLTFIFQVVLSFLALLFAYDAIAGEREGGTLRLVMTHPVSRWQILLAKHIGAMACLIVPLIISLLLAQIVFTTSDAIAFSRDDWLRIGGIALTSIVYLSAFYLIGLLISTATRRTATSLIVSLFGWVFLTLVYPNLIIFAIDPMIDIRDKREAASNEIAQIWERFEKEWRDYLKSDPVEGEDPNFNIHFSGGWSSAPSLSRNPRTLRYYHRHSTNMEKILEESEARVSHFQNYYQFLEPLHISTAEQAWLVRKKALDQIFVRQAQMERNLMRLSPAAIYDLATEAWAGTDLHGVEDFFAQARQYRQTLIGYFYDKGAFSSRQWFSSDKGAVDWSDLPQFSYRRADAWTSAKHALLDLFLLLLTNTLLFMATFLIFVKQEI